MLRAPQALCPRGIGQDSGIMRSPTFSSFVTLLNLPFLSQKAVFPREKRRSSTLVVLIVTYGFTPMQDAPEMHLLGCLLIGKEHGLGL